MPLKSLTTATRYVPQGLMALATLFIAYGMAAGVGQIGQVL